MTVKYTWEINNLFYFIALEFKAGTATVTATSTSTPAEAIEDEYEDEEDFEIILDSSKASEINK